MRSWHLVTCELAPTIGGVAGYTQVLAAQLASAGDAVHVWGPALDQVPESIPGVQVHAEMGEFGLRDLARVGRLLDQHASPRHLLVQWVPHGYGYRSLNLPFCVWLWQRALRGDRVDVMVHEPHLAFGEGSVRQDAAALVQRLMTVVLLRAASRVWTSIPAWIDAWRPYALGRSVPFEWLPVPSTIPVVDDTTTVEEVRRQYSARDGLLVGHLGTDSPLVAGVLVAHLTACLRSCPRLQILLVGRGGETLRAAVEREVPNGSERLHATGALSPTDLSLHLRACDVMIQLYPDGVSTRRTSTMAALSHGRPVITNHGRYTEPLWATSGAVRFTANPAETTAILDELQASVPARVSLENAGRELYEQRFSVRHLAEQLLDAEP